MRFVDVKLKCGWTNCTEVAPEGDETVFTRTIALDGGKTREIDICKSHSDALDAMLEDLLTDGRVLTENTKRRSPKKTVAPAAASPVASEDDLVCKVPDCPREGNPVQSKTGMGQHVIRTHGYENLAAYYEDYPPTG